MTSCLEKCDILTQECEQLNRLLTSIKQHVEENVASVTNDLNEWKQLKVNLSKTSVRSKVLLDVGGRDFSTTVETLTSENNTFFTALFSYQWELKKDERGRIFIDRNGDLFAEVLEYMRNPRKFVISDDRLRQRLINEAEFYKLHGLLEVLIEPERNPVEERQQMIFDSTTLLSIDQQLKLNEFYGKSNPRWQLLYKGSRDGFDSATFHRLCDNQGETMTVVQSTSGYLFGGYASHSWTSSGTYKNASGSFLYLLSNANRNQPTKFACTNDAYAAEDRADRGPTFGAGHDLIIANKSNENTTSYCAVGNTYTDVTGLGVNSFTGSKYFQTIEIEVFKLLK